MKVLILGTSNSLRKDSWVDGMKKSIPGIEIDNRSIGGSPGIQFAALIHLDFKQYDCVFFDSVPNDEEYEYKRCNYNDLNYLNSVLYELLATISSQSKLFVLGIPLVDSLGKSTKVMRSRQYLAKVVGAQFLDVENFLYLMCSYLDVDVSLSYENLQHPMPFLLFEFGFILGRLLVGDNIKVCDGGKLNFSSKYLVRSADFIEGGERVEVNNSILNAVFYGQKESSILFADELSSYRCLGFYANFHRCAGYLRVTSVEGVETYLNMNYKAAIREKVLKVFVPIPNGIKIKRIDVIQFCEGVVHSPLMMNWPIELVQNPEVSISDFIFRLGDDLLEVDATCHNVYYDECEMQRKIERYLILVRVKEFDSVVEGIIRSYHNTFMYYDKKLNFCMFLPERFTPAYPNKLYSVRIQVSSAGVVDFYYCDTGDVSYLSLYDFGVAENPEFSPRKTNFDKRKMGERSSAPLFIESHNNGLFSLVNNYKYMRVTNNFSSGFRFDRELKASNWEMLSMKC